MTSAGSDQAITPALRLQWSTRLRWYALLFLVAVASVTYVFIPYRIRQYLGMLIVAAVYNGLAAIYLRLYRQRSGAFLWSGETGAVLHLLAGLDLIILAIAIHASGGVESVLMPVYLVYLPAAALFRPPRSTYIYASLALALLASVFGLEYAGVIGHHPPSFIVDSDLHRQGLYVAMAVAFQAVFLYSGAFIAAYVSSQLRARREEVAQARTLTESIFDAIDLGIVVLDGQGMVLRFNTFMGERYGWTEDELGRSVFKVRPDLAAAGLEEKFETIVSSGQLAEYRNLHRRTRQGLEVYQNLRAYPLHQGSEITGAVIVVEDVTQQARLELDLQNQITRRETIARLSQRISSILEVDELLQETVEVVAEAFGYYNVAVLLVDESAGDLTLRADAGRPSVKPPSDYRQAIGEGMIGWVAQSGKPLLSNDARQEPLYKTYLPDTRSELCVPLNYGDNTLGVLDLQSDEPDAFDEEDLATLRILADQLAVAIENARLYSHQKSAEQTIRRRVEELSVLHRTALAGAEARNRDDLIERITQILATTLYPENVGFLLVEPATQTLRLHSSYHGVTPDRRQMTIPLSTSVTGAVAQTGEPLLIPDVRQDPRYLELSPTVQSELCVPLRLEGRVAGVINVESPDPRAFSQEDLHLALTVAEHAGTALEKLSLFEETRRRNEELAARNVIARAVSRSLDVEDVLEQLHEEVDRLLAPDTFLVALYDADDKTFDAALVVEEGKRLPQFSANVDETGGLTAWVIRERQSLLVRNLAAEIDELPAHPKHYTRPANSWLGVPLVARGRVVGVLSVQSFEPNVFDERDRDFLSAVADQVAVAVDNARLYQETRRMASTDSLTGLYNSRQFYESLENELVRAERYQHPVSLIMLDLDDFKKYNDRYGHLAGDDLLRELGTLISAATRQSDVAARYGGEEFAIILPETKGADATNLAERLRQMVQRREFHVQDLPTVGHVTVSLGVASYPDDARDVKRLVHCADMALLAAKTTKNRVCVFQAG